MSKYKFNQLLIDIDGVVTFSTRRKFRDTTIINQKLSLVSYNPIYETADNTFTEQNINLDFFKYAYFKDLSDISSRIEVVRQG